MGEVQLMTCPGSSHQGALRLNQVLLSSMETKVVGSAPRSRHL